jgi:hypothetical protein
MTLGRAPKPSRTTSRTLAPLALAMVIATLSLLPSNAGAAATGAAARGSTVVVTTPSLLPAAPDFATLCARLEVTQARTTLCSHGPDPVDAFGGAARLRQTSAALQDSVAAAPASELTALCSSGGVSGKRIEVIYGVPQDRTNNYNAVVPSLRDVLRRVNNNLEAADASTSQNYRFLCANGVDVTVRNVTLIPVGADAEFTFGDFATSLQNQVALGLGPVDFIANDRLYLTYIDGVLDAYPYGGQGELALDDQPSPALNANNDTRPRYSMAAYLNAHVIAHEIGHNIGAVQYTAPHTSGAGHCHDDYDLMCYNDGGSYFASGGAMTYPCQDQALADPELTMDCNDDDYYFPGNPPASNYLDTHWNTADSGFLTPLVSVDRPTAPTSVTTIAGDSRAFVSWAGPASGAPVVDEYRVAVIASTGDQFLWAGDGSQRTVTISDLANGTTYRVTVTAQNSAGSSADIAAPNTVTPRAAAVRETFTSSAAYFTEIRGGTWTLASGRYSLTSPSTTAVPNANLALQKTVLSGDFSLMATGSTVATSSPWNDFSIVFNYRDATNYYFANFSEGQDAASNGLFRVSNGTATQIADISTTITPGTYYPIRIERQGSAIRVFRGNALVAKAIDSTFTSGKVGFGTKNDGARFDDLVATGTVTSTDSTAPTVSVKAPTSLATRVPQTTNATATFSEAVQGLSGTTMRLKNPAGTVISAAVSYDTASRTATLNPSANLAPDTKYSVSLTGGTAAIRDGSGNPLVSTGWSFTTGPAPTITARTPAGSTTGASRTASVSVTFSEAMAGVAASTFTLRNSATGALIAGVVSRSGTTNTWILNPNSSLAANTNFTVGVSGGSTGARDLAGNPVSTANWTFSTGA